jgi:hypothetical protein
MLGRANNRRLDHYFQFQEIRRKVNLVEILVLSLCSGGPDWCFLGRIRLNSTAKGQDERFRKFLEVNSRLFPIRIREKKDYKIVENLQDDRTKTLHFIQYMFGGIHKVMNIFCQVVNGFF